MPLLEPTNLLLLACALIYAAIGEPREAAILLDDSQQRRSQRALAELTRLAAPLVRLQRNGVELKVAPEQVQRGDQLRLEEGDRVAADARLNQAVGRWLDESLLTGESRPVLREQPGELIRAGSLVASGRGWAQVVATGADTELGQLGQSLAQVKPPLTRLQRRTRHLTARLTGLALGLCTLLLLIQGTATGQWSQALLGALALALAVLPNEIPVVLARWPAAVESLGGTTVLAVDETGTLTQNRMAVQQLLNWPQQQSWHNGDPLAEPWHQLVELAVLASRRDPIDAMEVAIQRLANEQLHHREHLHPDWPLWRNNSGHWQIAAKGAPEAIAAAPSRAGAA